MGLEAFTGKVSDLVETNPPGTDPKSQGDDHLRGIKKTIIGQAINTQVGQHTTASENHLFDGSVANEITLKRGTVDAPGVELIKAVGGVLSFPNQAQSLSSSGYVELPGGLIIQWGYIVNDSTGSQQVLFPKMFPNSVLSVVANVDSGSSVSIDQAQVVTVNINDLKTGFVVYARFVITSVVGVATQNMRWIAVGY